MKVAILLGSVRNNRDGIRAKNFACQMTAQRGWDKAVLDPFELNFPLIDKMFKEMENPSESFISAHNELKSSDGFLIVTPEYNHSLPPALKNLLDHFREEYFWKPSAIISYSSGPFGGVRAAEHLKQICSELKCPSIPSSLPITKIHETINEDGKSTDGSYERRSKKFFDEFEWYLNAFKSQREKGIPV